MTIYRLFATVCLAALILFASACATTSSIKNHPLVVADSETNAATVYLLRPEPLRTRGIADNDVQVEIDSKIVTMLSAGEYVALKVKPGKVELATRSYTYLTSKPMPEEVLRSAEYTFEAGKKYFILVQFTQEEFRGIYFKPVEINPNEAKKLGTRLKPHGKLAKALPIEAL